MTRNSKTSNGNIRSKLAIAILIISVLAITLLACIAIIIKRDNTMPIFNIVLPVFASWVGTILAFYFGRENFESANQQVQELVKKLTTEQRSKPQVSTIMRSLFNMVFFKMADGKGDQDVKVSDLKSKCSDDISRLPIIDSNTRPKYMIHNSSISKYLAEGGKEDDTLGDFIDAHKKKGLEYGLNKGFVVVSEQITIGEAKRKMEDVPSCQDIFITKEGSPNEPLTGWISNVRLSKYLEA